MHVEEAAVAAFAVLQRIRQLRRAFEHILRYRDRIWLTRPRDLCAYIESLPPGIVPGS